VVKVENVWRCTLSPHKSYSVCLLTGERLYVDILVNVRGVNYFATVLNAAVLCDRRCNFYSSMSVYVLETFFKCQLAPKFY
jgi:hypothetical protein